MITPTKKPSRRKKKPRAWNSTLPAVAPTNQSRKKKLGGPRRKKLPARKSPPKKVNPERQAKRRKTYAAKLAAYRRSECYREVERRAGGRCEAWEPADVVHDAYRCFAARGAGFRLTHHHKTYRRFGGAESPRDITVLCDYHNIMAESKHPTRRRDYRRKTA